MPSTSTKRYVTHQCELRRHGARLRRLPQWAPPRSGSCPHGRRAAWCLYSILSSPRSAVLASNGGRTYLTAGALCAACASNRGEGGSREHDVSGGRVRGCGKLREGGPIARKPGFTGLSRPGRPVCCTPFWAIRRPGTPRNLNRRPCPNHSPHSLRSRQVILYIE